MVYDDLEDKTQSRRTYCKLEALNAFAAPTGNDGEVKHLLFARVVEINWLVDQIHIVVVARLGI